MKADKVKKKIYSNMKHKFKPKCLVGPQNNATEIVSA